MSNEIYKPFFNVRGFYYIWYLLYMNTKETIDAIEKMMESFILPSLGIDLKFKVSFGDYLGSYEISVTRPVDMMKVLPHSPQYDKNYVRELEDFEDSEHMYSIVKTIKRYLSISAVYVVISMDYQNTEQLMKQANELKREILSMSKKSKDYEIKNLWVDVWMEQESFNVRLDIGGEVLGDDNELEWDIAEIINNDDYYDYLSDVIEKYGEISFWFNV